MPTRTQHRRFTCNFLTTCMVHFYIFNDFFRIKWDCFCSCTLGSYEAIYSWLNSVANELSDRSKYIRNTFFNMSEFVTWFWGSWIDIRNIELIQKPKWIRVWRKIADENRKKIGFGKIGHEKNSHGKICNGKISHRKIGHGKICRGKIRYLKQCVTEAVRRWSTAEIVHHLRASAVTGRICLRISLSLRESALERVHHWDNLSSKPTVTGICPKENLSSNPRRVILFCSTSSPLKCLFKQTKS